MAVGGWPDTRRADFDQQLIGRLTQRFGIADPCAHALPGYVFRYGSTGTWHAQHWMQGPEDEGWYGRAAVEAADVAGGPLAPRFDAETSEVYAFFR